MKISVEFHREQADDAEVIGKLAPTPQEFVRQFCKELQDAYDNGWLAGSFQVTRIALDDGTITVIK